VLNNRIIERTCIETPKKNQILGYTTRLMRLVCKIMLVNVENTEGMGLNTSGEQQRLEWNLGVTLPNRK